MKRFKVNKGLYLLLPIIMILIIAVYFFVLYKKSYTWINIANLVIDALILVTYLTKFPYEVSMDSDGVNFYTLFRKYRDNMIDIQELRQAYFLTKIETKRRSFYVLTTIKGRYIMYNMFKDIKK
jgi:hypothetical protein